MANFTINSLSTGTFNSTDNFLKSDTSGALTKLSGSDLKSAIIGPTDLSGTAYGSTITEIITQTELVRPYLNNIVTTYFSQSQHLKRMGSTCYLELIGSEALVDIPNSTTILTVEDAFKGTSIPTYQIGYGTDGTTGAFYPVIATIDGSSIKLAASAHNGKINAGDHVFLSATWVANQAVPSN